MINIIIEGAELSGKSHLVALIGKYLKNLGCIVTIQAELTHNAGTLAQEEAQLLDHLKDTEIVIKEMRTAK
jgi:thymidylate kinase